MMPAENEPSTTATKRVSVPVSEDIHHQLRVICAADRTEMQKLVPELIALGLVEYRRRKEQQ